MFLLLGRIRIGETMKNSKLYANIEPIKIEASCRNCVFDHTIILKESDGENLHKVKLSMEVFDDFKCEKCGCNAFDVILFYTLTIDG